MRPASILSPLPYYGIGAVERLGTRFGKKKKKLEVTNCEIFINMGQPSPLFVYFFLFKIPFYNTSADLNGGLTRIMRVEGRMLTIRPPPRSKPQNRLICMCNRHSSVKSSVPTIERPRVRIQSTTSTLL